MNSLKKMLAVMLSLVLVLTTVISPVPTAHAAENENQSIILNVKSKETMYIGATRKIRVRSVTPNGSSKKVTYKSSDSAVVKVSNSGTMTALTEGKAVITITCADNKEVSKEVNVTVKNLVKNKTYNKMVIALNQKKKTKKLSPASKVKVSNLTFISGKKKVASVSKAGVVKGKKVGTAKITIKGKKGSVKGAKQVINLYVAKKSVKSVALNKENVTLKPTETVNLTTTVTPNDAANVVIYETSDKNVATVDQSGKVTAIQTGAAKITATTVDGGKKAVCTVTVSEKDMVTDKPGDNSTKKDTTENNNTDDTKHNDISDDGNSGTDLPDMTETESSRQFTKAPYISTYYFKTKPSTEEDIIIPVYITDSEQKEYIELDDSKRFDVSIEIDGKEKPCIQDIKAGNQNINLGKLSAGEHSFAFQVTDKETGIQSHKLYNDVLVCTPEDLLIDETETYYVTKEKLAEYGINNEDSTDEQDMDNTRTGLTAMFKELQECGYKKCVLLEGTYRINSVNHDYKSITIPTNFTVDMNGSTFKLNVFTGEDYASIVNMNGAVDSHLMNGTLEGNRFERKELGLETGYLGGTIFTFLFKGCKYCSISNMTIKDTAGHTLKTDFIGTIRQDVESYTNVDIVDGKEVESSDRYTSNMVELSEITKRDKYVRVGQEAGYSLVQADSAIIYVHFYDQDQNYIKTEKGYQLRKMLIPENAVYGRVTFLGKPEGLISFYQKRPGEYYEIKNVDFIDTRTTAIAPDSCENVLIENCTFTRCGNSITPAAVDFEDGYCEMQDIYYKNNKVIEAVGTATVIDCGGYNHVYEDNQNHTIAVGLNAMGVAITSSGEQTEITRLPWELGPAKKSKYHRLTNISTGNININAREGAASFVARNCTFTGVCHGAIDTVTFDRCVFTNFGDELKKVTNSILDPKDIFRDNLYCYNCVFKNLDEEGGDMTFSYTKEDATRIFENCDFVGKSVFKSAQVFNRGVYKSCNFDDLSMEVLADPRITNVGIVFEDCKIKTTAENFITVGLYAYNTALVDILFKNCELDLSDSTMLYMIARTKAGSRIRFEDSTIFKTEGKMVDGKYAFGDAEGAGISIEYKNTEVDKTLDYQYIESCVDAKVLYE